MPDHRKTDDLLREVIDRACTDREFRHRLLADPASAIRHAFGVILPHNYRIRFMERPRELDALIVLPGMHDHLDEEDLEQVAGGGDTDTCGSW
jgi:hypothetical protein